MCQSDSYVCGPIETWFGPNLDNCFCSSIYLFIVYIFSQGSQRSKIIYSSIAMVFNLCFFINLTRLGVYCLGLYQKVFAGTTPMIELEMLRKL